LATLQAYHWPGNVRELKNLLESLLVSAPGEVIGPEDLPRSVRQGGAHSPVSDLSPGRTLADVERELIRRTLEYTGGNRTHSASMLDIGVRTLQRKIRTYGIRIPPKRRRSRTTNETRRT
ncbi:MAG: sigma-54-dependent Fis family transcriptional regulator, partial [Gammaproteobacteria bacterium]|nr:sigma-54-dependent Fis family transcriptional regulator [Gammaproteobacteria bacterium]